MGRFIYLEVPLGAQDERVDRHVNFAVVVFAREQRAGANALRRRQLVLVAQVDVVTSLAVSEAGSEGVLQNRSRHRSQSRRRHRVGSVRITTAEGEVLTHW